MDNIAQQARQGSVAAIIQILNEKLADAGVRTRAMFADGVLQLLCEAASPEQLEQSILVDRVRQILESIGPRSVRRVNINSRIVREQQLLWLEEISRDRDNQLLWSEEIRLRQPNPMQRFFEDRKVSRAERAAIPQPAPRKQRAQQHFWRGILGGISLSALLLLLGWVAYAWQQSHTAPIDAAAPDVPPSTPVPSAAIAASGQDPFTQAVRIAEQAARDGQVAQSAADWLDLATRWQRASELMSQVPPNDGRYSTAQDRIVVYQQNSQTALQRASSERVPTAEQS